MEPREPLAHGKRCLDALFDGHRSDTLNFSAQCRVGAPAATGTMSWWFCLLHRDSMFHQQALGKPESPGRCFSM